jgi:dTDP-4-dehydrorhamnose reductase
MVMQTAERLERGERVLAADDLTISPTYAPELVHVCLDLLVDGESGIWHLANEGAVTWAELARQVARLGGFDEALVVGRAHQTFGWRRRVPAPQLLRANAPSSCSLL